MPVSRQAAADAARQQIEGDTTVVPTDDRPATKPWVFDHGKSAVKPTVSPSKMGIAMPRCFEDDEERGRGGKIRRCK